MHFKQDGHFLILSKTKFFVETILKTRYNGISGEISSMSSIGQSKIKKKFNFCKVLKKTELPAYIRQYIKQEEILTIYRTQRDHGVFTDKKIVLFDNEGISKTIYTIPYQSISSLWIEFNKDSAKLNLYLDSGVPLCLRFCEMSANDKLRLRILYTCLDKLVNGQEPIVEDMEMLIKNSVKL